MTKNQLAEVLKLHAEWLADARKGARADLRSADLRYADLRYADLSRADLRWADLSGANLSSADLRYADLRYADLSRANLSGANLRYADLSRANLSGANLSGANLSSADLRWADLSGANLSSADLRYADLRYADLSWANWGVPLAEQVERLDAVREIVLAKPERLYMADWHRGGWTPEHTPEEERSCGSSHCIAGWLQALSPDPAIRQLDPLQAGVQLAPIAAPQFYADADAVLAWFKERTYAVADA